MAYGNYLASVDWAEVEALRNGLKSTIAPHNAIITSHILPGAAKNLKSPGAQPVATCLADIFDRGELLSELFWHPLRLPVVHSPQTVRALFSGLRRALEGLDIETKLKPFFDLDISPILNVLGDAVENGLAVVSVLEPPADNERAQRVACPFSDLDKLPVPWGRLRNTLNQFAKP